ncbi:cytochrome P450 [Ophiobolus disseminans]|uniref:Cytochrome P450 n=1 Tax=Ophiobolus disseminans TaxID=1469910 RepID=A0A6A7AJN8_9PLEO|nr:cytochrome P450 [Ophiobolus disseminans]
MESEVPFRWPLGIDILKAQYDALPSQQLLAFQSPVFDKLGANTLVRIFEAEGYRATDPKNIKAILDTSFEDWGFGSRSPGLFPFLGNGIFTQDGRPWKHSREVLRKQFARMQYQNLTVLDEHINNLLHELSSASAGIIDPYFFRFTLSTTTYFIFSEPMGTLGDDVQTSFKPPIRLRLADFHWLYQPRKYKDACTLVKRYADSFVSRALEVQEKEGEEAAFSRYPFIIDLYRNYQDLLQVRDQLINVLIAGRDTTACLSSWAFFLRVRHPTTMERLRNEITAVLTDGSQPVIKAILAKMPYLKSLRLYPQLPVNVRVAMTTTVLPSGGGPSGNAPVLIKKGVGVGYSIYHMHRMAFLYGEDASEFHPERLDNTDLKKRMISDFGFLPFHGGPRTCLGKEFALMEASYAVIRVIQRFPGLRLPPDVKKEATEYERQNLAIVVSSAEGCKVLFD